MKTTGDGFFVLFDSPARAVRGAAAMLDTATAHGLIARAGIHPGKVELQGDEVRGITVHTAARILGVARPGEVLVSATIRDLLSGWGLEFADRGEFQLRGLDGYRSLALRTPCLRLVECAYGPARPPGQPWARLAQLR